MSEATLLYKVQLAAYTDEVKDSDMFWAMGVHADNGGGLIDLLNRHHQILGYHWERVGNMKFVFALTDVDGWAFVLLAANKLWTPFELELPQFERTLQSESRFIR